MVDLIIKGTLMDTDSRTTVGLKFTGGIFRIADKEYTRSFDLSIPATKRNNEILELDELPEFDGVRTSAPAMISDGGVVLYGVVYLHSYSGGRYDLLFVQKTQREFLERPLTDVPFNESITVDQKTRPTGGHVPAFGWYLYDNGTCDGNAVGSPVTLYPSVNLGYLIQESAANAGYTVYYLNGGSDYEDAANYGIILPTMNTFSSAKVTVDGNARGGWTYVVSGGLTLADVGLSIVSRRYKKGLFGANVNVFTFTALRHIRVRGSANLVSGPLYAQGEGRSENWLNWQPSNAWVFGAIDIELNAGEWFTMVAPADINDGIFTDYIALLGGYETNIPTTTLEVLDDDGIAGEGETIYLRNNLPDMTLADLLTAYCNLTCSSWTVDDDTSTITVETFAHALSNAGTHTINLDSARVVSVDSVERFLDGFAQHNRVVCKPAAYVTDEHKFARDYPCANDLLEDEAEYAVVPFNEGNYMIDGNGDRIAQFEDVTVGDNGEYQYKGILSMFFANLNGGAALHLQTINDEGGMGGEFAAFTNQAATVRVTVLMSLIEFAAFTPSTVCVWRGRDYIIRTATWGGGKCAMELVRLEI